MENKLFKDLENVIQPIWSDIFNKIKNDNVVGIEIKIDNKDIKNVFDKYLKDNKDYFAVNLVCNDGVARIDYYYKNQKVNPECYYIATQLTKNIDPIDILRECIIQDTNRPDIKHLETPNKM